MANDIIRVKRSGNVSETNDTTLTVGEFLLQKDSEELFIGGLNGKVKINQDISGKVDVENGNANNLNVDGVLTLNGVDVKNFYDDLSELGLSDGTATMSAVHSKLGIAERIALTGSTNASDGNYSVFLNSIVESNLIGGDFTVIAEMNKVNSRYTRMLQTIINADENENIVFTAVYDSLTNKITYNLIEKSISESSQLATNVDFTPTYKGFPFTYVKMLDIYVIVGTAIRFKFRGTLDRNNETYPYIRESKSTYDPAYSSNMVTAILTGVFNVSTGNINTNVNLYLASANSLLSGYNHQMQGFVVGGKYERSVA